MSGPVPYPRPVAGDADPDERRTTLSTAVTSHQGHTTIRDFTHQDRDAVITLVAGTFVTSRTGRWLDPNPTTGYRYALHRATAAVDGAVAHGTVRVVDSDTTPVAAALWVRYPTTGHPPDPLPGYSDTDITDPQVRRRADELDRLLRKRRPGAAREHLTGLGVHPDRNNDGLRTYLLTDRHHALAGVRVRTCLDTDNAKLRQWCRRHGYLDLDIGDPVTLPGTRTRIWPMWRPPAAADNCTW